MDKINKKDSKQKTVIVAILALTMFLFILFSGASSTYGAPASSNTALKLSSFWHISTTPKSCMGYLITTSSTGTLTFTKNS